MPRDLDSLRAAVARIRSEIDDVGMANLSNKPLADRYSAERTPSGGARIFDPGELDVEAARIGADLGRVTLELVRIMDAVKRAWEERSVAMERLVDLEQTLRYTRGARK